MKFGLNERASARTAAYCLAAFAALAAASPAAAGALQVDPIRVDLSTDRKTGTVTVTNDAAAPVTIHATALAWSQAGGEDRYQDTSAVIVSPPIFTIPAGGTQTVRVGLRSAAGAGHAYRLIIEEVPQANPQGGIQVALRLNLPLFAMVQPGSTADLSWAAWQQPDGSWAVEARNGGAGHVRVDAAQASAATGISRIPALDFAVLLPHGSRRWTIATAPAVKDRIAFQKIVRPGNGDGPQQLARKAN
jgi:fimbrial chaperone protein